MPIYNLTGIATNSTSVEGFFQGVNTMTGGALGLMFLIGISVVAFSSFFFTTKDVSKSMAATAFVSFVVALFFKMLGMIDGLVLYTTIILAGITIAFSFKKEK